MLLTVIDLKQNLTINLKFIITNDLTNFPTENLSETYKNKKN